jgi:hypothetical protein
VHDCAGSISAVCCELLAQVDAFRDLSSSLAVDEPSGTDR